MLRAPKKEGAGMKLILTAAVDNLGAAGDIVEVKDGYGRNFLIPRGFAIRWTRGGEKQIGGIKRSRDAREIRGLDHAQEVREQLEALTIDLPARAGDTGKLFGAVTAGDVAAAIKKAGGPLVDKRAVQIAKPIKTVGLHTVGVKLHDAVTAHVRLVVDKAP
jgi:large subunit ribosomal protein L9